MRRSRFAQRIAEILVSSAPREGRVFAIRGAWGYGKSSLKNLVVEALASQATPPLWLEFNPWQWGNGETIARALFSQMAAKLGGPFGTAKANRARAFRRYASILNGASRPLRKAGDDTHGLASWVTPLALVLSGTGISFSNLPVKAIASIALVAAGIATALGHLLAMLGRDHTTEPLDVVRRDLEERLQGVERPLIVFVDDIDRLEQEEIRLLFRQIKVNANLPNIIFVLLYQPSIVEKALEPVAGAEGKAFLEKIVQANFDLPPVSSDRLFKIFIEQLVGLIEQHLTPENGFEQVRWGNTLLGAVKPFIKNLRDMRRLLSSIAIHLPLHEGARVFEVNIIDFLVLETLRVFEPELHRALVEHKALLLQTSRFDLDRRDAEHAAQLKELVGIVAEPRRKTTQEALTELFPTVAWAFGGSHYGNDWVRTWADGKRVCAVRYFDRYFELQLPEGSLSDSDFINLMESAVDENRLKTVVASLTERQLLPELASRLDESVDKLPVENIGILLPAIFDIGEVLGADRTPFNIPFIASWRSAVWYLRRIEGQKRRSEIMLAALSRSAALSVPAVLISLDLDAREKNEPDAELLFHDDELSALKAMWVARVEEKAAAVEPLLDDPALLSHLYRWRDFAGSFAAPRAWVDEISQDDVRFAKLLVGLLSVRTQHGLGDRVEQRVETYHRETIAAFFDVDALRARAEGVDRQILTDRQAAALNTLLRQLTRWSTAGDEQHGRASSDLADWD